MPVARALREAQATIPPGENGKIKKLKKVNVVCCVGRVSKTIR